MYVWPRQVWLRVQVQVQFAGASVQGHGARRPRPHPRPRQVRPPFALSRSRRCFAAATLPALALFACSCSPCLVTATATACSALHYSRLVLAIASLCLRSWCLALSQIGNVSATFLTGLVWGRTTNGFPQCALNYLPTFALSRFRYDSGQSNPGPRLFCSSLSLYLPPAFLSAFCLNKVKERRSDARLDSTAPPAPALSLEPLIFSTPAYLLLLLLLPCPYKLYKLGSQSQQASTALPCSDRRPPAQSEHAAQRNATHRSAPQRNYKSKVPIFQPPPPPTLLPTTTTTTAHDHLVHFSLFCSALSSSLSPYLDSTTT